MFFVIEWQIMWKKFAKIKNFNTFG